MTSKDADVTPQEAIARAAEIRARPQMNTLVVTFASLAQVEAGDRKHCLITQPEARVLLEYMRGLRDIAEGKFIDQAEALLRRLES